MKKTAPTKKAARILFEGKSLTTIKVADKPLPCNPEIKELAIPAFNQLMSKHRGTAYEYSESIFTTDDSFKFTEQKTPEEFPVLNDLVVCWINDKVGYGVYTTRAIPKGTPIVVYTGELCRPRKQSAYAIGGFEKTKSDKRVCVVDAQSRSGIAGFIQSSLDNWEYYSIDEFPLQVCNVKGEFREQDGITYSVLIPTKDIAAGQQLLVNYGLDFWDALAYCGIVERAFSAADPTQTPPADLFTFSDDYTIPMLIHMLRATPLTKEYQERILDNICRFHHSLFKFLPSETQQQLYNLFAHLKKQLGEKPFSCYVNLFARKNTPPHQTMTECYEQKLSGLAFAATFEPDKTAKPLISSLEKTDSDAVQCPEEDRKRFVRFQADADVAAKQGNLKQAMDLLNLAIQGFSNIYQERCAHIRFGHTDIVVHITLFHIHTQLHKIFLRADPEKAFHHAFVCYNLLQHPDISSQLTKEKIRETQSTFDAMVQQYFAPTNQVQAQFK